MEVNKEEALRCLGIAQRHRNAQNYPSALKFARKSVTMYSTAEGEKMVRIIEEEMTSYSEKPAAPAASGSSSSAKASGVEEHVTSARQRHPAAEKREEKTEKKQEKRQYTAKQIEVVTRVKRCGHTAYYQILSIEKTCSDNDVKRAYKKLALQLHPDKNGAPGADEAFKMVSKAFQVLSDKNLRAVYDQNPSIDPTQRGGGGGGGGGGRGGGMARGFQTHGGPFAFQDGGIDPDDLFNMFFGGGGGGMGGSPFGGARVYTFGGGGPTYARRRPAHPNAYARPQHGEEQSPLLALLPIGLLILFILFSVIPSLFAGPYQPDPGYSFAPSAQFDTPRHTWQRSVPYHVNRAEFEQSDVFQSVPEHKRSERNSGLFSSKMRAFERGIEENHIRRLQSECQNFNVVKNRKIRQEAGVFGLGADYDKIRKLRAETNGACEQLRRWGLPQQAF